MSTKWFMEMKWENAVAGNEVGKCLLKMSREGGLVLPQGLRNPQLPSGHVGTCRIAAVKIDDGNNVDGRFLCSHINRATSPCISLCWHVPHRAMQA